jgi:hypothetical protein
VALNPDLALPPFRGLSKTAQPVSTKWGQSQSNALAAPCTELTDTATRYPGTDLTLAYSIKHHP